VSETDSALGYRFGFTGRERDVESDLQFNRARYYDASTGRWISEDPIGFAAGDTNLNRYVGNGPVDKVDPWGLEELAPGDSDMDYGDFDNYEDFMENMMAPTPMEGNPDINASGGFFESIGEIFKIGEGRDWGERLADPETIIGQLFAGDIHENQIWGDLGITISHDFIPGPLIGGGGFEIIYDWDNDGQGNATGWNVFFYGRGGIGVPGGGSSIGLVNVYNFVPGEYTEWFINHSAGYSPKDWGGGPSGGFSYTPKGLEEWLDGKPVTKPYSHYVDWNFGGTGPSFGTEIQYYWWLNSPDNLERIETVISAPQLFPQKLQ
jgi:RHS repeat-associated protein